MMGFSRSGQVVVRPDDLEDPFQLEDSVIILWISFYTHEEKYASRPKTTKMLEKKI